VLLLARVVIGYGFYEAGKGKLGDIQKPIGYFTQLHIPYPVANAWFVTYVEYIGGALMIVGFISRPVCAILAIDMIVAYWTADHDAVMKLFHDQDMATFMSATPFWFLVASLLVTAVGPGWFSIDGIINALVPRRKVIIEPPPTVA
jgi:putative oxidoreductase